MLWLNPNPPMLDANKSSTPKVAEKKEVEPPNMFKNH